MPKFGKRSLENLAHVHPDLRKVLDLAITRIDFTVICGQRDKEAQERAFKIGTSKVHYPNSAHNPMPACASDFIPYPFKGWKDRAGFVAIAETIVAAGDELGIPIRSGADWDRDGIYSSWDAGHVELHPWRNYA